jgi:hypothetical protein
MNVITFLIATAQSTPIEEPVKTSFHDAAVLSETTFMLCISLCNERLDLAMAERSANFVFRVACSISEQFIGTLSSAAVFGFDTQKRIDQRNSHFGIMNIGCGMFDDQRNSLAVGNQVPLRAILAAIRGLWASLCPPKTARILQLSIADLLQSIKPLSPNSSRILRQIFVQTPAFCQSRSRRQQVIPLPQFIYLGRYSQGVPVLRTNRIPVNAARFEIVGRPPLGFGRSGGDKGSILFQSSSGKSCLAIASSMTSG